MEEGDRYASAFENLAFLEADEAGDRPLAYDSWQVGSLRFLSGSAAAMKVDRSGDVARFETFSVSLLLTGTSKMMADERVCLYEPGDLIVVDECCPYVVEASATSFITMLVDRERVLTPHQLPDDFSTNARKVSGLVAVTLAAFVRTMIFNRQPANKLEEEQISRAAGELLRGVRLTMRSQSFSHARPNLVQESVRAFVKSNLTLGTLTPETIAAALSLSRSTLYRAFATTGGVSHLIQASRLEAVHDLLLAPGETRSIAELADIFQFSGAAHFSRVFKARYGLTPQRLREQGRLGGPRD